MITMSQSFKNFWKNYFNFTGTATRAEYWWMALWSIIISIVWFIATIIITVFSIASQGHTNIEFNTFTEFIRHIPVVLIVWCLLSLLILLAFVIPTLSLSVRRYRDSGLNEVSVWILFALSLLSGWGTPSNDSSNTFFSISFSIMGIVSIIELIITVLPTSQLANKKVIGKNK
ncbi:DUF805 domain-containing protein [Leuconostoc palmae]|uniref:DUF805 domain-containing protein n=1 Tax=Leuconostoc palmae TaxID=501487 RepID=UPI001C7D21CC|nr:DUF805 domain-containing protein [Leuconostoc palmae]